MSRAQVDRFAHDRLPSPESWPTFQFELPSLQYPEHCNAVVELLDRHVAEGRGPRIALRDDTRTWTYTELLDAVNQHMQVLQKDLGLVPGNRVLLRGWNSPQLAIAWLAVVKAGLIAVATMPMLRAKELTDIIAKAQVQSALCEASLLDELTIAKAQCPSLNRVVSYGADHPDAFEKLAEKHSTDCTAPRTALTDIALIAFTSGTTGKPKGTVHFHRDLLAACDCFPPHVLKATPDDVFIGTPPLAFTFGLGGLLLFPMRIGASTVLLPRYTPESLMKAAIKHRATVCFTAPTFYRQMAAFAHTAIGQLRRCVSAGEALPDATRVLWRESTGLELIDGIGATELMHIFISSADSDVRAGATGKVVPGYRAALFDDAMRELPLGSTGRLGVQGPTGCRYLDDARQSTYVQNGWNLTGDIYRTDADGYFFFVARGDDMIISAGYNIAGPEVEAALLTHPAVAECAVVGQPDEERGQIVCAFVVLKPEFTHSDPLTEAMQDHVKSVIAPYKYPRRIEFRAALPRTETGKLQRFRLKESS